MPNRLTVSQLRQEIGRGRLEPVYVLEGEELFFHEESIRLLEGAALGGGSAVTDRESVRGTEITIAGLLDRAATYPMGGGRRLTVVRGADGLRGEGIEALRSYLARPNPKGCLVFSDTGFDRRRALYRALEAGAVRVDCAPLDEARAAAWVRERLRARGFGLSPDLAEAIAAGLAGAGLGRVDAELQKLMSAIGAPRPVEAADLVILVDVPKIEDVFRVAVHAVRGERGEAIARARALLRSGEDPVQMLGGLAWYVRNALRARAAGARRLPPRELVALYGIDPGRVERFQREAGPATLADLRRALALCLRADRELKGQGARDPAHAFERLIHRAAPRPGRPA
jgi:DNA polymerase-3 subunit delta